MRIKSSAKTLQRNRLIGKLDDLARERCLDRDERKCVRCGKGFRTRRIQWCHIISRRHLCTRWELDNNLTMCGGCHMWWHDYPSLSGPWFSKNWPERHEKITALYNRGGKVDLRAKLQDFTLGE